MTLSERLEEIERSAAQQAPYFADGVGIPALVAALREAIAALTAMAEGDVLDAITRHLEETS